MRLIAGKSGRDMQVPEPIVQVGFEPDEIEMREMVSAAELEGRDVVHISFHADDPGRPVGMIAVIYFENGRAHAHRRGLLVCGADGAQVVLAGVSDEEDERCHFVMSPGRKMVRIAGHPVDDLDTAMQRAAHQWFELARSEDVRDCDDERLTIHPAVLNYGAFCAGPKATLH